MPLWGLLLSNIQLRLINNGQMLRNDHTVLFLYLIKGELVDLESIVLNYLNYHKQGYTRKMYNDLKVKDLKGLSLNKFRKFLIELLKQKKITFEYKDTDCDITYWTLPKE